ncbi:SANT and BTB domain regulator of class switch recombination-like isoform X1 [Asterias amurensis]|uniref:SANT and BTB domain regulator of class switch recombination-like isoform X1 n=1 Tax=Asterias amurensis TaxID=7602 RepID=UPI003AB89E72
MIRRDSPSRAVALDLILRTFMNSSDFNNMQSKNWDAISKLIPGSTPQECSRRFQELQSAAGDLSPVGHLSGLAARGKPAPRGRPGSGASKYQQPLHPLSTSEEKNNVLRQSDKEENQDVAESNQQNIPGNDKRESVLETEKKTLSPDSYGPNMVIHVCDEAKNVKKDFTCPRDLLVSEMRYFAEYLSSETQRWEEVDISVHCDVQIFHWLMSYVKRHCPGSQTRLVPNLEASNVISILISSDFLKMDSLVSECVEFCHKNMSAIVATPCNMNCINDKLCTRIADLFTDLEVDEVKDRKDKFKSKLICKKIEGMFEGNKPAATLYRCQHCKRLLTSELQSKLKCIASRMSINRQGNITYHHQRDPSWDINDYLLGLRADCKSWREVYWRLWATVNHLTCSRCKLVFPCSELGHCRFHPELPKFDNLVETVKSSAVGTYGCCQQKTLRFDPLNQNTGCQVKDHIVMISKQDETDAEEASHHSKHSKMSRDAEILDILLQRKDIMCIPPKSPEQERWQDINLFKSEETLCGIGEDGIGVKGHIQNIFPDDHLPASNQPDHSRSRDTVAGSSSDFDSSDDEMGDEEVTAKVSKHRHKRLIRKMSSKSSMGRDKHNSVTSVDSSASNISYRSRWDPERSLRFNQDAQREEDLKRSQMMVNHLAKMRTDLTERSEKSKPKEFAGGLFSRLEYQFKTSSQISKPTSQVTLQRAKTRANQLRTT